MFKIEKEFKGTTFLKFELPYFWKESIKTKNNFYNYVYKELIQYEDNSKNTMVDLSTLNIEYWERHCDICFREISLTTNLTVYTTKDLFSFICDDCYDKYKKEYKYSFIDSKDIPAQDVIRRKVIYTEK